MNAEIMEIIMETLEVGDYDSLTGAELLEIREIISDEWEIMLDNAYKRISKVGKK